MPTLTMKFHRAESRKIEMSSVYVNPSHIVYFEHGPGGAGAVLHFDRDHSLHVAEDVVTVSKALAHK